MHDSSREHKHYSKTGAAVRREAEAREEPVAGGAEAVATVGADTTGDEMS